LHFFPLFSGSPAPDSLALSCYPAQIPDGLTNHYMKQCGIKEPDVRM